MGGLSVHLEKLRSGRVGETTDKDHADICSCGLFLPMAVVREIASSTLQVRKLRKK